MMRDGLMREVEGEMEAQRAFNRAEEIRRLEEASGRDPVIGALVSERTRIFQEGARNALAYPKDAQQISDQLSGRIAAIQAELRARLVQAGLPDTFLQPVYRCPHCKDTGYVGEPIHERCSCVVRKIREHTAGEPGYGLDSRETFATYDDAVFTEDIINNEGETQRSFMERLRLICLEYAEAYPRTAKPNMLIVGLSGLGKTFLVNCIGNHIHQRGYEVMKLTAYQLNARIRSAVFDHNPDAFSAVVDVPLLLLDDLGVEPMYNNITVEHMFTLLNERMLSGRHTIISTNLMPEELRERYTERVTSRLFDQKKTKMVFVQGTDVRLRLGDL